jgi:hypothetical protein
MMTFMRLRFTIRDLLWLTAVVALAVGWWVDHHDLIKYKCVYSELFRVDFAKPEDQKQLDNFLAEPGHKLEHD